MISRGAGIWRCTRLLVAQLDVPASPINRHLCTGQERVLRCRRVFTHMDVQAFLELTGDGNPIHIDAASAIAAGFKAPIVPGMLLASLFPALVGSWLPGAVYVNQTLSFRAPAEVGSEVEAVVTVTKQSKSHMAFLTQCFSVAEPRTLLVEGKALAILRIIQHQTQIPAEVSSMQV